MRSLLILLSIVILMFSNPVASRGEEGNVVKWDAIIGLTAPGSRVGNIDPFGPFPTGIFSWVTQDGKAWVHLHTGRVKFSVKGLVLANSTPLAVAGTAGVTTEVKGTLVCNGSAGFTTASVDTSPIPLSPQGNAEFVGVIAVPTACLLTPDKLAFLIRVASVNNPDASIQIGRWIAVGGIRTP